MAVGVPMGKEPYGTGFKYAIMSIRAPGGDAIYCCDEVSPIAPNGKASATMTISGLLALDSFNGMRNGVYHLCGKSEVTIDKDYAKNSTQQTSHQYQNGYKKTSATVREFKATMTMRRTQLAPYANQSVTGHVNYSIVSNYIKVKKFTYSGFYYRVSQRTESFAGSKNYVRMPYDSADGVNSRRTMTGGNFKRTVVNNYQYLGISYNSGRKLNYGTWSCTKMPVASNTGNKFSNPIIKDINPNNFNFQGQNFNQTAQVQYKSATTGLFRNATISISGFTSTMGRDNVSTAPVYGNITSTIGLLGFPYNQFTTTNLIPPC